MSRMADLYQTITGPVSELTGIPEDHIIPASENIAYAGPWVAVHARGVWHLQDMTHRDAEDVLATHNSEGDENITVATAWRIVTAYQWGKQPAMVTA